MGARVTKARILLQEKNNGIQKKQTEARNDRARVCVKKKMRTLQTTSRTRTLTFPAKSSVHYVVASMSGVRLVQTHVTVRGSESPSITMPYASRHGSIYHMRLQCARLTSSSATKLQIIEGIEAYRPCSLCVSGPHACIACGDCCGPSQCCRCARPVWTATWKHWS